IVAVFGPGVPDFGHYSSYIVARCLSIDSLQCNAGESDSTRSKKNLFQKQKSVEVWVTTVRTQPTTNFTTNLTTLENVPYVLLGELVSRSDVDVANAPSHEEACNVTRDLKPASTRLPRIVDRDFRPRGMRAIFGCPHSL
ncbi:unnamed protein product, partial [Ectocarpus sp. 13 AM-2016]